jgi:hypothetical protein
VITSVLFSGVVMVFGPPSSSSMLDTVSSHDHVPMKGSAAASLSAVGLLELLHAAMKAATTDHTRTIEDERMKGPPAPIKAIRDPTRCFMRRALQLEAPPWRLVAKHPREDLSISNRSLRYGQRTFANCDERSAISAHGSSSLPSTRRASVA